MQYQIKKLQPTDLPLAKQSFILFKKVFDDAVITQADLPADEYLNNLLSSKGLHIFAAMQGGAVVGGVTAYELPMYFKEEKEMYLYDLAVSEIHRRQGIAGALINALKAYAAENGISTIFVEALAVDEGAVNFYKSTGAEMEQVCHFNFKVR